MDDQGDYRPDSPEQEHRKCPNFPPKFHSSKHLYSGSCSDSSQQECISSSGIIPKSLIMVPMKESELNSDDINELKNELKQQKAEQKNEFSPQALDSIFGGVIKYLFSETLYPTQDDLKDTLKAYLEDKYQNHDFEKNDAPSQESVKIIVTEETGENENTDTAITIETQEQTITENILNSREINDELFGVNFD
ncbi:18089_t:CDS:2 [Dentiscutata erythropus]|uniref:18089_t:CDS:1 n=1 Tax=Dentiscutata erythropus TaxID=1348616 RepID=A0A9N9DJ43_9GLOM|nr:18089_t:CDS:2 [Dentiscutata erythropus]